jgi:hypothetical protein
MSQVEQPAYEEFIASIAGPRVWKEEEKPVMITEAARKIPVPSWWQGGVTSGQAAMIAAQMRPKEG